MEKDSSLLWKSVKSFITLAPDDSDVLAEQQWRKVWPTAVATLFGEQGVVTNDRVVETALRRVAATVRRIPSEKRRESSYNDRLLRAALKASAFFWSIELFLSFQKYHLLLKTWHRLFPVARIINTFHSKMMTLALLVSDSPNCGVTYECNWQH